MLLDQRVISKISGKDYVDQCPPFASCPRSQPSTAHRDWKTLGDLGPTRIFICPTCFDASISPTLYRDFFTYAPTPTSGIPVKCSFASYWNRAAYRSLFDRKAPNPNLLKQVADIWVDDGPCPNEGSDGKSQATRLWYTISEVWTNKLLYNFTICSSCLQKVKIIYPVFCDTFKLAFAAPCLGSCDLLPWQKRTSEYLGIMSAASFDAAEPALLSVFGGRSGWGQYRLSSFVSKYAHVPECPKNVATQGQFYIEPSMPSFSMCEECHLDIVLPAIESADAGDRFKTEKVRTSGTLGLNQSFTCRLYSARMREIFQQAVRTGNLGVLRAEVQQRKNKENELTIRITEQKRRVVQLKQELKMWGEMALQQQNLENLRALSLQMSSGHMTAVSTPTLDPFPNSIVKIFPFCCVFKCHIHPLSYLSIKQNLVLLANFDSTPHSSTNPVFDSQIVLSRTA